MVALLFAYLLSPLVKFLDRRLPGRSKVLAHHASSTWLPGSGSSGVIVGLAIGSRVVQQANALAVRLPELLARFENTAPAMGSPAVQSAKDTAISAVQKQLASHSRELLALLPNAALEVISRAGNLVFIVLVPILSFFFLKDGQEMRDSLLGFVAAGSGRDTVEKIAADLHVLLAQYMRALVLMGVVASALMDSSLLTDTAFPVEFCWRQSLFPWSSISAVGPLTQEPLSSCWLREFERIPSPCSRSLADSSSRSASFRTMLCRRICSAPAQLHPLPGHLRSPGRRHPSLRRGGQFSFPRSRARHSANRLPAIAH